MCKLQHTLEKRNITRGRAVKLQIALTAGRAKTSAVLCDSTRGARKQRDSPRPRKAPHAFFALFVFNWTASNSIHLFLCRRTQMKHKSEWTLSSGAPFEPLTCVCVWDVEMCASPYCTCIPRDKPSAAWMEDLKDSLVLQTIPWPKSTPPRERARKRDCFTIPGWSLHSNTRGNTNLFQSRSVAQHLNTVD